ncbi:hypothetical protein BGZ97_012234 [Linnemannia gamsii]|jgi:uncharacterized membrane protein YGL010W|uniref:DUF962-domain-containing protein n=1 Tax=Linnemannia gamsii TaxID=64522 RepID=A0A9P6R650_9FUNG|nr:hypothetical protein BGZ97_012234 [Linnemannia gamsii]
MSRSKLLDLKYQMLQHGSQHHNPVNIGLHVIFIPLIIWASLVWGANSGPLIASPSARAVASGATIPVVLSKLFEFAVPNASMIVMSGYVTYYIALDRPTGLLSVPIFLGLAKHATHFLATNPEANKIAAYASIVSFLAQFIGHGIFEKRSPELGMSFVVGAVLGPYFLLWEVLFFLGYRPQLKQEVDVLIKADIAAFRAKKALKKKNKQNQ